MISSSASSYSGMSVDIFNEINSLLANPTAYAATVSGAGATAAGTFSVKPALTWSNCIQQAALDYANDKASDGSTTYEYGNATGTNDYIRIHGMEKDYCRSICGETVTLTVASAYNTQAGWTANMKTQMSNWLGANKFEVASLKDGTYTHMGVACTCATNGDATCYITFTDSVVGTGQTTNIPLFYDYLDGTACAAKPATGEHGTPVSCAANEYYDGAAC